MKAPHRTAAALAALTLAAACGGGDGSKGDLKVTGTVTASGDPSAQTASLDMTDDLTFEPNVVNAKVGNLNLAVANAGQVPHNLVFDDPSLGKTDTVRGKATATLSVKLSKAGTYRFVCTFHSGMDGQVVVTG
jgi:plastocyanin